VFKGTARTLNKGEEFMLAAIDKTNSWGGFVVIKAVKMG